MKTVQLSSSNHKGGAARAAHRLHEGLLRVDVDSHMCVGSSNTPDPRIRTAGSRSSTKTAYRVYHNWLRRQLPQSIEYASSPHTASSQALAESLAQFDIANLHWISDFIDWPSFFKHLPTSLPLAWTLHDMNPMRGGVHYDPYPGSPDEAIPPMLRRRFQRWHKLKVRIIQKLPKERLTIVTPSRWLTEEAKNSETFAGFDCVTIPNSIDTDHYQPRDRSLARRALDIPEDRPVVGFVSETLDNPRKGTRQLREAIEAMQAAMPDLWLLSAGAGEPWGEQHRHLGSLSDDRLLATLYSAADVFAIPSLSDNLPNTMLESFACGVPCIAFDVGGIPDMVINDQTGVTVPVGDSQAFAEAGLELLRDRSRCERLGKNCRAMIEEGYRLEHQGEAYRRLYTDRIARWSEFRSR